MKKLLIDIEKLIKRDISGIKCEYLYHGKNNGVLSIVEVAEFAVYCRQCKNAHCVKACPKDALERQPDGTVKRYNLLCVGCKSCVLACPFGTLFPETISYVTTHCDFCLSQINADSNYVPLCAETCSGNTIRVIDVEREQPENGFYFAGKYLAIRAPNWRYKEGRII
ncbi:4Fe-4S dicluster domain-containing protein [Kosmotoga sp.]|uniref:4Fe-4S dicluster domain-containing protein n=1 Tax=Kosmotoga sp. TaxID=1955248 RepID=UPI0024AC5B1A|nr:4Fe-4S dicluster domain-containing protein [Kosmotoga sp.]MDI3523667.1 hypothetical protein [Kosmotoga sp.]